MPRRFRTCAMWARLFTCLCHSLSVNASSRHKPHHPNTNGSWRCPDTKRGTGHGAVVSAYRTRPCRGAGALPGARGMPMASLQTAVLCPRGARSPRRRRRQAPRSITTKAPQFGRAPPPPPRRWYPRGGGRGGGGVWHWLRWCGAAPPKRGGGSLWPSGGGGGVGGLRRSAPPPSDPVPQPRPLPPA